MSRHTARWGLKRAIAAIGATIIISGTVTVPVVVSTGGSLGAAKTVSELTVTVSPCENNWT